eukprot:SAG31_NODE_5083_length_2754_cov_1.407533_1_plen_180_part_00
MRDLGSHKAGLPRYSPCNFGACNISTETALARIANWTLLFEPGSDQLAYSNTGFALLGRLLERAVSPSKPKERWEKSLASLASVLGMVSTTGTIPTDPAALARVAVAFSQQKEQIPLEDLGFSNPAGGVFSTADDMAKFLSFLMRSEGAKRDDANHQPLDSATVWMQRSPSLRMPMPYM